MDSDQVLVGRKWLAFLAALAVSSLIVSSVSLVVNLDHESLFIGSAVAYPYDNVGRFFGNYSTPWTGILISVTNTGKTPITFVRETTECGMTPWINETLTAMPGEPTELQFTVPWVAGQDGCNWNRTESVAPDIMVIMYSAEGNGFIFPLTGIIQSPWNWPNASLGAGN